MCRRFRPRGRRPQTRRALPRPRVADGVELIGEYKGSGFRNPPYLVRRADGQVVQLTRLLFLVAAAADGARDLGEIASAVGAEIEQPLSPQNVAFLVENKLAPAGVVALDGRQPTAALPCAPAPLAFTARRALVPPRVVQAIAFWFQPLFWPVLQGMLVGWLVVVDGWLFFRHGLSLALTDLLANPVLLLGLFVLVTLSTFFHELGHAAACRYGGARPGAMGIGLYLVWPAFFTDVTDAYRLGRAGRLRTDLGGVYFNGVFALGAFAVYVRTGFEPILALVLVEHLLMVQQLVPWVRLDGYYVLTDLVGVPDILSRIKPLLSSLVPGREPSPRVTELKPWARAVATAYVLTLVPVLACLYALLLVHAPRTFASAAHSLAAVAHRLMPAFAAGRWTEVALDVLQLVALTLPLLGIVLVLLRSVRYVVRRLAPQLRLVLVFAAGVGAAFLVGNAWTNGSTPLGAHASPGVDPIAHWHARRERAQRTASVAVPAATAPVSRAVGTTNPQTAPAAAAPRSSTSSTPAARTTAATRTQAAAPTTTTRAQTSTAAATTRSATTTAPQTTMQQTTTQQTTTQETTTQQTTTAPDPTTTAGTTTEPPPTTTAP